jgi:hypothetical protein
MSTPKTDPALWTVQRKFGVAGGADEIVLTDEGRARAWCVGTGVRRGGPAEALEALWSAQGEGYIALRDGSRMRLTPLGKFDQIAWGALRTSGLVESFQDDNGDGVRLTKHGRETAWEGAEERKRLLERCRRAAAESES